MTRRPPVFRIRRDPRTWAPLLYEPGRPLPLPCYASYDHYRDAELPTGDGLCYPFAFVFARRSGGIIVHGTIMGGMPPNRFPHAWVERGDQVTDNDIFRREPDGFMSRARYYRIYRPQVHARYAPTDAMDLCEEYQSYGPFVFAAGLDDEA